MSFFFFLIDIEGELTIVTDFRSLIKDTDFF